MLKHEHEVLISVLTNNPRKQNEIKEELAYMGLVTSTRHIRRLIYEINTEFIKGAIPFVIISNKQGTFKSIKEEEIKAYNECKKCHALSELYMSYNVNKRLDKNKNMSFKDYIEDSLVKEFINEQIQND